MDSNRRPLPCQESALDQLSYRPIVPRIVRAANDEFQNQKKSEKALTPGTTMRKLVTLDLHSNPREKDPCLTTVCSSRSMDSTSPIRWDHFGHRLCARLCWIANRHLVRLSRTDGRGRRRLSLVAGRHALLLLLRQHEKANSLQRGAAAGLSQDRLGRRSQDPAARSQLHLEVPATVARRTFRRCRRYPPHDPQPD